MNSSVKAATSSDTIAAPITGPGAVAIVRLSGPATRPFLAALLPNAESLLENPRRLVQTVISDKLSPAAAPLDEALAVFFPSPHSYTGEDTAEFHIHGSPYIRKRLLENLLSLGARLARPGEFTERAYLNGKLDLSQAEAVADLIAAETEAQARAAREQLEGRLSSAILQLGEPLRDTLAEIEAQIDFPEEDIDPLSQAAWKQTISAVISQIDDYLASYTTGKLLREGADVVIAGLPNAGKSSLLNRLIGEERAIVTPIAGTTRDSIHEHISLNGILVRLWDTAGLEAEEFHPHRPDEIERLGIAKSWERLRQADIVLYLYEADAFSPADDAMLRRLSELGRRVIKVANKSDLHPGFACPDLPISALTGEGFPRLKELLAELLVGTTAHSSSVFITTERHFEALKVAKLTLFDAINSLDESRPPELTSLLLRSALNTMQEMIGATTSEEILGRIFSRFCIGK